MTEEDEEYLYIPTITQQKIVSVLSTVSSIFSIIGSWSIMYNVIQNKTKTPCKCHSSLVIDSLISPPSSDSLIEYKTEDFYWDCLLLTSFQRLDGCPNLT